MRIRMTFFTVVTILAIPASSAWTQELAPGAATGQATAEPAPAPDITKVNFLDLGFRGTAFSEGSDQARYQRYRDLRNGITPDAFRYFKDSPERWITVDAEHIGYRDQRYKASLDQFGKLKVSFEWNQIPLFFSESTQALHTEQSPGVLRVDDAIQTGIERQQTTLPGVVGLAVPFDLRLKRSIADLRLSYAATEKIDVNLAFKNTMKEGDQPWGGTFGFGNAVELAVPVDTRTTDLGAALEWADQRGSARVAYDGSFFHNNIDTLVWDNPLRISDSPSAGPSQGRMSLWPDSTLNTGSVMGALNLPQRSRATAYISVGNWSQNAALVPFTINTALPAIPLDRATADTSALVTAMHYNFTSRPTDKVTFMARYRSYDFDNRTPEFHVGQTVAYDTSVATFAESGTSPYSFNRKSVDAEVSYTPVRHTALRAGYTLEKMAQTFRQFDSTTENTVRLSADVTGTNWLTLRGVYEHARRTGSGLDDQVLDDIGEQVSLRQFDMSPRTVDRFSAVVMVMPLPSLSFNGYATVGSDERSSTGFGVLNGDVRSYSIGLDLVPRDPISFGISYVYDKYATLQRSRQANPGVQFDDPTRDWTTDASERADTITAGLDLIKLWPRTDLRFAYDYSNGDSRYVYGLAPDTTLPSVQQLPIVSNRLQRATFDVRYYLTRHTAVGGMYWYDQFKTDDYATEPATLNSIAQPSFLMIGYTTRPYTANTFVGRVTYIW
jgi:MtrB/PioB family decaheme-associated outer membrane protein